MIKQKTVLTERQKQNFKKLINKANDLISENAHKPIGEKKEFVIAGQLRIPDKSNNIKEPEIEFGLFTGKEARMLTDTFIEMREGERLKYD